MKLAAFALIMLILPSLALAEEWRFKGSFLEALAKQVPAILKAQDKQTGRFGTGIWIVNDQNAMYPLAVAWATKIDGVENPFYQNAEVLEAIMSAGDALIADQKPDGQWEFRKKDGSTWGDTFMPWTYSRWVRSYGLVRESMPADRRAKWEKAITLGMQGIADKQLGTRMQNIPAHNAMGLYRASQLFNRKDWEEKAVEYLHRCAAEQNPDGWWTENSGPVVVYNAVYVDLLGCYYGMSKDKSVLPALERSTRFHAEMTYPDGRSVETVDERNPYHLNIAVSNVGFSFTPQGRAYIKRQIELLSKHTDTPVNADAAATFILYGEEGELAPPPKSGDVFVSGDKRVMTRRDGPWFFCLTSYHTKPVQNRWIQDRQNFLSIYRDGLHVILGGGNTKLQPLWSTLSVGDTSLLYHKGDENPEFLPPAGLMHTPTDAALDVRNNAIDLTYGEVKCRVAIDTSDANVARITYELMTPTKERVEAHLPLLVELKEKWATASGKSGTFAANEEVRLHPGEAGEWLSHRGWRVSVPAMASIAYPVLPHNPYRRDGHAEPHEARMVMTLPFDKDHMRYEILVDTGK